MKRLLDSNVFITAKNTYYGFDIVPVFWTWLESEAKNGAIVSIDMVFQELQKGKDELADWAKARRSLIFNVTSSSQTVANCVREIDRWARVQEYKQHVISHFMNGADPFLIAVAADLGCIVVTEETPKPRGRQPRDMRSIKIPDVCKHLNVPCENTFQMMRHLNANFT